MNHRTPTEDQIREAERLRDEPMSWAHRLALAIALVASCAFSVLLPWGCTGGVTLP